MSAHLSLPSECGERHEARLAERSEAELAKVFDRIVKGCWMPATKLGLGRRKSHHPFSLPRCECSIVSGCWRRTVHVVLPSDGEHISQLHATQLRVDGCDNNGQTQPSEERHSLGSGRGGVCVGLRRTISTRHPWLKKAPHCFQVCLIRVDIPGKGSSPRACAERAGQKHRGRGSYRDPIHHRPAPETAL